MNGSALVLGLAGRNRFCYNKINLENLQCGLHKGRDVFPHSFQFSDSVYYYLPS